MAILPDGGCLMIGTENGAIEMVDTADSEVYERIQGHSKTVGGIAISKSVEIATADAAKEVHFWGLSFSNNPPVLVHWKTLKLEDEIYSISCNHDFSVIGVGLYGSHRPMTAIAFSDDGELICTGSSDMNIRIWDTEFGDCHRSLWAHDGCRNCIST
jgi:U3 small nucleolar RNA-associated protein 12